MSGQEGNKFWNFVFGLAIGIGGSILYIRFGIELPTAVGGVGQKLTKVAVTTTAEWEVMNPANSPIVRRRALAVLMANDPTEFMEVDRSIGDAFINAYMAKHKATWPTTETIDPSKIGIGSGTLARDILSSNGSQSSLPKTTPGTAIGISRPSAERAARKQLHDLYPDASASVIDFLLSHQELLPDSVPPRQATLPAYDTNLLIHPQPNQYHR